MSEKRYYIHIVRATYGLSLGSHHDRYQIYDRGNEKDKHNDEMLIASFLNVKRAEYLCNLLNNLHEENLELKQQNRELKLII